MKCVSRHSVRCEQSSFRPRLLVVLRAEIDVECLMYLLLAFMLVNLQTLKLSVFSFCFNVAFSDDAHRNVTPQSRLDLKLWSCHTLRKELLGSATIDLLDTLRNHDGKSRLSQLHAHLNKHNMGQTLLYKPLFNINPQGCNLGCCIMGKMCTTVIHQPTLREQRDPVD